MTGRTVYETTFNGLDAGAGGPHPNLPNCHRRSKVLRVTFFPQHVKAQVVVTWCWSRREEVAIDFEATDCETWVDVMHLASSSDAEARRAFGSVSASIRVLGTRAVTGDYADCLAWDVCARLWFDPFVPWIREHFPKYVEYIEKEAP